MNWQDIEQETIDDFRTILRFDTTNPPGNEGPLADFLAEQLRDAGLDPQILHCEGRPNLVVRLRSDQDAPGDPLLLAAHLDVVPAEPEQWTHPPFEAVIDGEYLYGRGTVDMKNMVAMCLTIVRQLVREKVPLKRDIILAYVSDEEEGCHHGSQFLVEQHPELVKAGCMIGEVGGFSLDIKGIRYYPIQVAEKGRCRVRVVASGQPGHGSVPHGENALVRLGEALVRLGHSRLPQHPVKTVQEFIKTLAATQGLPASLVLPRLLNQKLSGPILQYLLDETVSNTMAANLSNTVSPTILEGGTKNNVIPGQASILLDGRLLPGQTGDDLLGELREVLSESYYRLERVEEHPGRENPGDHPLLSILMERIHQHDPGSVPIPYMTPAFTDASAFGKLVPYCFGFAPMRFPVADQVTFAKLPHSHDERIHLPGFKWGLRVLWDAVVQHCAVDPGSV